jgi:hypothetical protein
LDAAFSSVLFVSKILEGPLPRPERRSFVDNHFALLTGLAVVVLAGLRVYLTTGLSLPTALTVLSVVDRAQLLASTVLATVSVSVPLLYVVFFRDIRRWMTPHIRPSGASRAALAATTLFWMLGIFWMLLTPLWAGLALSFTSLFFFLVVTPLRKSRRVAARKNRPPKRNGPLASRYTWRDWFDAFIVNVCGIGLVVVMATPWLPREAVFLQGNDPPVVGHVVGTQGDMTLLLEERSVEVRWPRDPLWVKTDRLEHRITCGVEGPLLSLSAGDWMSAGSGADCEAIKRKETGD